MEHTWAQLIKDLEQALSLAKRGQYQDTLKDKMVTATQSVKEVSEKITGVLFLLKYIEKRDEFERSRKQPG